jgi:hypothetical protein
MAGRARTKDASKRAWRRGRGPGSSPTWRRLPEATTPWRPALTDRQPLTSIYYVRTWKYPFRARGGPGTPTPQSRCPSRRAPSLQSYVFVCMTAEGGQIMKFEDPNSPWFRMYVSSFGQLTTNRKIVSSLMNWGKMTEDEARAYMTGGTCRRSCSWT